MKKTIVESNNYKVNALEVEETKISKERENKFTWGVGDIEIVLEKEEK